ncbi:MAG: hypothetical protein J5508_00410, partial [Bacteroidales bacterium]|nr:hypothetical protein [Bacteroidales bacterium]
TLTQITSDGGTRLLDYESGLPEVMDVAEGYYLLTTGLRLFDGSVLARLEFFNVAADEERDLVPTVRESEAKPAVIGSMDPEALFAPDSEGADESQAEIQTESDTARLRAEPQSLLSATGRGWFLLAFMGHLDEPTSHAVSELEAAAPALNEWGRPVVVLGEDRPAGLENAVFGQDVSVLQTLPGEHNLPVVAICDSFGRVVYLSEGYNTSLAADLERLIPLL